ncbi:MAG TPA: site-specific integrase [Kofleriaceae bacterium]|nr:site-specific integrase [Kofleriaceae bacterium]
MRISGTAPKRDNTKAAAEQAERDAIYLVQNPTTVAMKKECPTYDDWFNGRFWKEWVIGERNKPSEQIAKRGHYKNYLGPTFGTLTLEQIGVEQVQQLRAKLVEKKLSDKTINNIMAVLSKSLRYAVEVELIEKIPRIRLRKVERPEIEAWTIEEYATLLEAARQESPWWYAAVCLAGEAGLRIGEIRALKWREDIDLIGGYLTVNRQAGNGHVGTPKGRTRRSVPMTSTLVAALEALPVDKGVRDLKGQPVRDGYVLHNDDRYDPENETKENTPMRDAQTSHATYRVCERAGLPNRGWHALRHSFGTHAARFGVNPWQLMEWMGHKRIDETMGYVHIAERHRSIPAELVSEGMKETDPTDRVLKMLAARAKFAAKFGVDGAASSTMSAS